MMIAFISLFPPFRSRSRGEKKVNYGARPCELQQMVARNVGVGLAIAFFVWSFRRLCQV